MKQINVGTALTLLDIFWPAFVEVDGCIFLATGQPDPTPDFIDDNDRSEIEAFYNHTHIIDLFKHNADHHPKDEDDDRFLDQDHPDFNRLCKLGKTIAQMWFQKLRLDFPHYDFRVYYALDDDPVVRFQRVRPDVRDWIDEEYYIDQIERGKVVIYDTRHIPRNGQV